MYEFQCKYQYEDGDKKTWFGQWELLTERLGNLEFLVRGRGSEYRVVIGHCSSGNYLCIPSENIGCGLASQNDYFWNLEQISRVMNITDAVTIASALYNYSMN